MREGFFWQSWERQDVTMMTRTLHEEICCLSSLMDVLNTIECQEDRVNTAAQSTSIVHPVQR